MEFKFAREALKDIIKSNEIQKMYIPYYLCDVVRHSLAEVGCKPCFYHIDDNFYPNEQFPKDEFILYPNYFGICDSNVDKLCNIYPNLIVDNAHAYYSKPQGFAAIYSPHKFQTSETKEERILCFRIYHEQYKDNLLDINLLENSIPFCYPYLASTIEKADKIAKELQAKGLTIYRYWNPLPKSFNEYKFYSRLVPIPLTS